jgi:succinylarginine dihydrolase
MAIIAPLECQSHAGVQRFLARVLTSNSPVKAVNYVDLRQSMRNGGGPACLRLRVVMPRELSRKYQLDDGMIERLTDVIRRRYRDDLRTADLADPDLIGESRVAIQEIWQVLGLRLDAR